MHAGDAIHPVLMEVISLGDSETVYIPTSFKPFPDHCWISILIEYIVNYCLRYSSQSHNY